MSFFYIYPYIPSYGSENTSATYPLAVEVDGRSITQTVTSKNYYGVPDKLLSLQSTYKTFFADISAGTEHTLTISYDSNFIGDKEVDLFISAFPVKQKQMVDRENISNVSSVVWNDNKTFVTIKFTHSYKLFDDYMLYVAFFPKAGSTPVETYTFKRNANIVNATCNYTNGEEIDINKPIYITADTGYQFDGTQYPITYNDTVGYFTISEDKSKLTYLDFQSDTNYEINSDIVANAIPTVKYEFLLEGNIVNATCNYANGDEIDTSKAIVITAIEGYQFTGSYNIYYGENTGVFTVSSDKKTLTFDKLTSGYNYIIKEDIQATAVPKSMLTITGILANCTCNYSDGEEINNYKRLEITVADNFYFKDDFAILKGSESVALNKNEDKTLLYLDLDDSYNYTIANNIYGTKATTKYQVKISGTLTNCTCNYTNGEYISIFKPQIIVTANKGYEFKLNTYYLSEGATDVEFEKSEDSTTLTYTIDSGYTYYLEDTYKATKAVNLPADFIHLYTLTKEQLNALAKVRFNTSGETPVDYGVFINKLYYLPFAIDEKYLGESEQITLGYYTATTQGTLLEYDTLTYELPAITYEGKYGNVYDYKGISFEFNVPFFEKFELEAKYVVGQTLSFIIKFNVYSNKASLYVKSTVSSGYIYNADCVLGVDIPYMSTDNRVTINNTGELNSNLTNEICLTVYRNSPAGTVDEYGHEVNKYVTIGDIKGKCTFDECTIVSSVATDVELRQITDLLNHGVTIA